MVPSDPTSILTGAILVGGRSRRMGRPKVAVRLRDGSSLGGRVLRALQTICGNVVLVGSADELPRSLVGLERIPDLQPGKGPLAGIEALLRSGRALSYLVSPCDLPDLDESLLRNLVPAERGSDQSVVRPTVFRRAGETRLEPLPALIPAAAAESVSIALDGGRFRTSEWIQSLDPVVIELPEAADNLLRNVNRPEDLD